MDYMTLKEASEKWGISARQINYYCVAARDRPDRGHRPPPRVGEHLARTEEVGASAGHSPIT